MRPSSWGSKHGIQRTTLHLATLFVFCYSHLKELFHRFGDKAMNGVDIQGHVASSTYFKKYSVYPHSFHRCLSFVSDIPEQELSWWTSCSHFHHHEKSVTFWRLTNSFFKNEFVGVLLSVLIHCCLHFQSFLSSPFVRQSYVPTSCHMSLLGGVIW
jgi:hypothetical protein